MRAPRPGPARTQSVPVGRRPAGAAAAVQRRALVHRDRAARMERAAHRQSRRIGRVTGQATRREPRRRVTDRRERPRQRRRVGVRGAGRARRRAGPSSTIRPAYITASRWHVRGQHRQVVADHQQPDVPLVDQFRRQVQHLRLHHHVQRGGRLVRDDQPRVAGQRHRDHHPLPLPAGQLVRIRPRAPRRQPDLLQQLRHAGVGVGGRRCRAAGSARRSGRRRGAPGSARASRPGTPPTRPAQRTARSRPHVMVGTSSPSSSIRPPSVAERGSSRSTAIGQRRLAAARTRPAMPSVGPADSVRSTPRTAGTGPRPSGRRRAGPRTAVRPGRRSSPAGRPSVVTCSQPRVQHRLQARPTA